MATSQVPVVWCTVITGESNDMRQTLALSCGTLAQTVISGKTLTALCAQEVASALWEKKKHSISKYVYGKMMSRSVCGRNVCGKSVKSVLFNYPF